MTKLPRRLPLWLELVFTVALALVVRHALAPSPAGPPVSVAFVAVIVSAIVEAFKFIADKAVTIGVVIYQATLIVGRAIVRLGGGIATVFKKTFDFFQTVWSSTIKPFISWAWKEVNRLHAWLVKTFDPVIKHLLTLRAWILDHYNRWLKPIFATIDAVRSTLQLLETFHVPFARKIDQALTQLEDRLLVPIRLALQKVNEAINWIDRIVSLDGLFQRLTLIESQWKYSGDQWNVLLKHQPAGVSREQNDTLRKRKVVELDAGELRREVNDYYATGGGVLAPAINANADLWRSSSVP